MLTAQCSADMSSMPLQELLDATHHILGELEKEHKAQKAPGATAEAAKPDADADELREKFRIVRVSFCLIMHTSIAFAALHSSL